MDVGCRKVFTDDGKKMWKCELKKELRINEKGAEKKTLAKNLVEISTGDSGSWQNSQAEASRIASRVPWKRCITRALINCDPEQASRSIKLRNNYLFFHLIHLMAANSRLQQVT